jgi:hypothetical protein
VTVLALTSCSGDDQTSVLVTSGGAGPSGNAGSDGVSVGTSAASGGEAVSAGSGGSSPTSDEPALYAISSLIFDDTGATAYVAFMDSLDEQTVDLSSAAEFPGWSSIATMGGALFVGGGEAPEVTRYSVTEGGTLGDGEKLSFAEFGFGTVSFSHNVFVDKTTAHLRLEETSRILWDPTELAIRGTVTAPEVARERDGLSVSAANFEGLALRADGVAWPYFWHDADWYEFHQSSQIGIYGTDGALDTLLDAPCPALNIATADEAGNLYFTGMVDTIAYQLLEEDSTLERCAVRINAGEHTIAEGWPRRFEELTEGRPSGRFYYLQDGVGILTVFHEERATLDPGDAFGSIFADNWGLWLVDVEAWRAEPIEGWGFGSSNIFFSRVEARTFLHRVNSDFSETKIYEITTDASVTPQITVPGYATVLAQVR